MIPCVTMLFRKNVDLFGNDIKDEEEIAKNYFKVESYRSLIKRDNLVIGRYSVLPYYKELEDELKNGGSRLINSYEEHMYIADITQYYEDIKEFTPKTYTTWGHITDGKWIVKGKTSSRKHKWNTHMFADGKDNLLKVIRLLCDDLMISNDGLVVREYVPLKQLTTGINGLPITNEWRLFFYGDTLLAGGFYWTNYFDELKEKYDLVNIPNELILFANKVAKIISKKTNFFVLDIAEMESGGYICVEVNDAQMSGLSGVNPNELYKNLNNALIKIPANFSINMEFFCNEPDGFGKIRVIINGEEFTEIPPNNEYYGNMYQFGKHFTTLAKNRNITIPHNYEYILNNMYEKKDFSVKY